MFVIKGSRNEKALLKRAAETVKRASRKYSIIGMIVLRYLIHCFQSRLQLHAYKNRSHRKLSFGFL